MSPRDAVYVGHMLDMLNEGILATTAGATRGVHEFFRGKPLRVMDLQAILDMQARVLARTALRGQ